LKEKREANDVKKFWERRFMPHRYTRSIKINIITGVLIAIPLIATILILYKAFKLIDSILPSFIHLIAPALSDNWPPGVGIGVMLIGTYLIGLVARHWLGKEIVRIGNHFISKIPFVNKLYVGIQQVLDAVFNQKKRAFEQVVLVEFPRPDSYTLGFLTGEVTDELAEKIGEKNVTVFIPTSPTPTQGFILFLHESEIIKLSMPTETAFKIIMSAGIFSAHHAAEKIGRYVIPSSTRKWNWVAGLTRRKNSFSDPRD
jgi:uncharacterized membrane protein